MPPCLLTLLTFDSVHLESLWAIRKAYGIPLKTVTIFGTFYEHFECSVTYPVRSGVRQGCIHSSVLFLVTIDWVIRQITSDRPRGIR